MNRPLRLRTAGSGFTMIELMVTLAIAALVITLAAPSFRRMIEMQRLRSITSQLVTDLQFARSEAVQRNTLVRLDFERNADMTCYTIYTATVEDPRCDCRLGPGAACPAGFVEVRTVQVPAGLGVQVVVPNTEFDAAFAFDNVTGGLYKVPSDDSPAPLDSIKIESSLDNARKLAVGLNRAGRPSVCAPAGSTMTEPSCPP